MSSPTIDITTDANFGSPAVDATTLLQSLQHSNPYNGVPSSAQALGFEPLDRVLGGGLQLHDLLVIGGRPGVGKTIFALQMARNMALKGTTVVYACYEHDHLALLTRLLAMEIGAVKVPHTDWYRPDGVRSLLHDVASGRVPLSSATADPVMRAAMARIEEYGHRLRLVRASPYDTGVHELDQIVESYKNGPTVLFVDYLQKVCSLQPSATHHEHVAQVVAGLKQISFSSSVSVVAIGALGSTGLLRRRTHLPHLDASVAVGYDSDVVILMNDKRSIVANNHVANTLDQSERFRQRVVFTVAKNRGGVAPVDVEFVKEFEHFRFDPSGSYVAEQLIEDGEHDDFRM
jgi:replicative DNA helicase